MFTNMSVFQNWNEFLNKLIKYFVVFWPLGNVNRILRCNKCNCFYRRVTAGIAITQQAILRFFATQGATIVAVLTAETGLTKT